jgi:hypothetical protein
LIRIAHLINPVNVTESSNFYKYQQITFKSIVEALNYTKSVSDIKLFYTKFSDEIIDIPDTFTQLSDLQGSIFDVTQKMHDKKLPFIKEIFDKFKETGSPDYYIYTNADIALMPYFYEVLKEYILKGHDAIVINRRRICSLHAETTSLSELYANIGKSHPGFDCFIFKADLLKKFNLGKICVGIPFVEATLINNIAAFSTNPLFVANAHITFHIGLEVMPSRNKVYYWHNRKEYLNNIHPKLKPFLSLNRLPYAYLPFYLKLIKWGLNPALFTLTYLELENKNMKQKILALLNELRWRILQR